MALAHYADAHYGIDDILWQKIRINASDLLNRTRRKPFAGMYMYTYTYNYIYVCAHIYIYMYIHLHIHIYIYTYVYIYIYAYLILSSYPYMNITSSCFLNIALRLWPWWSTWAPTRCWVLGEEEILLPGRLVKTWEGQNMLGKLSGKWIVFLTSLKCKSALFCVSMCDKES